MIFNRSKLDTVARIKRRYRVLWGLRTISLGLIMGFAGSMVDWGIQHHAKNVVFNAGAIAVLTGAVILLNWRLGD